MIHSKSQKLKKIILTDDKRLFYTRVKLPEEESNSQISDYDPPDLIEILPSKKPNKMKRDSSHKYKIGNYLIEKTLGQGTFGKVKLGIYLPSHEKVAIKVLEKDRMTENDDKIRVKREFDMLSKFNHPNVILVTEIFESFDSYYSVMEFCEGGELFNYIVDKKRLSENESSFFYFQIINGLEYIHSLGIVHRDLKPENLLLTKEHLLKIIDFGLSNYFVKGQKNLLSTPCGSPCYASPEMVAGKKYDGIKIDIWATGIILYAMLCGYLPFEDKNNDILFDKIMECKIEFPNYLSEDSKDLIRKILVVDPEKRIDIPNIKKQNFFLKGKKFFDKIFTIKRIKIDENEIENNSVNDRIIEKNQMKIEEKILKEKNDNLINEIKDKIKKEKTLLENKENINFENKDINKINKEKNFIPNFNNNKVNKNIIDENKNIHKNKNEIIPIKINDIIKENIEESFNNNKRNNKDIKKSKDLSNKYTQYFNKKRKIEINSKNSRQKINNGTNKKIQELNKKNSKTKTIEKTPDNKKNIIIKSNGEIIDKNKLIDTLTREKNNIGAISNINSKMVENLNNTAHHTNITNFMLNNINYNISISFENTKRTYSNENTKDDIPQNDRLLKNHTNNTIFNNNISYNTTSKNSNIINIIDYTNNINKNVAHNKLLNFNNKRKINSKNKKDIHNKMKRNLKDIRASKYNYFSNNIRLLKHEPDFNICKLVISDSHTKRNYKEFLSKQNRDNTINDKNNDKNIYLKSKGKNSKFDNSYKNIIHNNFSKKKHRDKKYNTNRISLIINEKILFNNKINNLSIENKKHLFKKIKNKNKILNSKDKSINKNITISTINTNSKKIINPLNNNQSKKNNKLQNNNKNYFNKNSMDFELYSMNIQTDPNLKNRLINKLTKFNKSILYSKINITNENKVNQNIKYSVNTLRKKPIFSYNHSNKDNTSSPTETEKNEKNILKYSNYPLTNTSSRKLFEINNNILHNFKMFKPKNITISSINKLKKNKKSQQIKKSTKNELSDKLIDKSYKSIEIRKINKEPILKIDKNKNINNIENINSKNKRKNITSGMNNNMINNNEILNKNLQTIERTSYNIKEENKSKSKNKDKNSKLIYDEKEKNKILKMNKFRNIFQKTNGKINEMKKNNFGKKYHIKSIVKISNIRKYRNILMKLGRNKKYSNSVNIKRIKSHSTKIKKKNQNNYNFHSVNNNHNKHNSMRINDMYKYNLRNKNKTRKVFLFDNLKNNISNNSETFNNIIKK